MKRDAFSSHGQPGLPKHGGCQLGAWCEASGILEYLPGSGGGSRVREEGS